METMRDLSSEPSADGVAGPRPTNRACPECGADLLHTNGCVLCGRCGYSPCD